MREEIKFAIEMVNPNPYDLDKYSWKLDYLPSLKGVNTHLDYPDDKNLDVPLEVTSLVLEAQRLNLPAFQFRLLVEDSSRLVKIYDSLLLAKAPLLKIKYY